MATFTIKNVEVKGISACVPKNTEKNTDYPYLTQDEIESFVSATGIAQRRVALPGVCTSDLCYEAADKLLNELNWDRKEVDVLVFVSQSADYILPVTSALLQDRLGLSQDCVALDVPLGCSGYIYGLSVVASMMRATGLKKGLLLVGDTSKWVSERDKSTRPLFGDGGAATALELTDSDVSMAFNEGTDGSGYRAIIIPDGGCRNMPTADSFVYKKIEEGIERTDHQLLLDGMDVFAFGINQAPKTVNAVLNGYGIDREQVDYFVFHQANLKMNKMIAKKLKLPDTKVPYSLKNFGNTSSASIPVTIVTELREQMTGKANKLVLCGFGVGLSWGTVYLETDKIVCPELIEI